MLLLLQYKILNHWEMKRWRERATVQCYVTHSIFSNASAVVGARSARVIGVGTTGGDGGGGLGRNSMPMTTAVANVNSPPEPPK